MFLLNKSYYCCLIWLFSDKREVQKAEYKSRIFEEDLSPDKMESYLHF